MPSPKQPPPQKRFIGLDIHKKFLVAVGVDRDENRVFGPHKVYWHQFSAWIERHMQPDDAVVIEDDGDPADRTTPGWFTICSRAKSARSPSSTPRTLSSSPAPRS